ncbi:MAG: helical backbone metal receptor [Actinomycetota bacterium]|nr:helical backbone metal receptor [Actinomycetota bacterium]
MDGAADDLGNRVDVPGRVGRIVSLVPSLTESVAESGGADLLVGVTDWCTHPGDVVARMAKVGGTKNPDVARVVALGPDLVLANEEENRATDLAALREAGLAVWVTAPETVPVALDSLERMLAACALPTPDWLRAARAAWAAPPEGVRRRGFVPIWRRPWMALGRDTFAGDLLSRLGVDNVCAESADRYPRVDLADIRAAEPELVVLPDEPYRFAADDGPEAFADWHVPVTLVSGRHLTWYGPSLAEARAVLTRQLVVAVRS